MDPEIVERLNEQLREMSDILSQQNASMAAMVRNMQGQTTATKNQTDATNANSEVVTGLTKKQQAYQQAEQQRIEQAERSRQTVERFNKAVDVTAGALMALGKTVMDSNHNFQKYNGIISSVGDTALELGRNFGILGSILGGIVKASTAVINYQLEQADALLKFNDNISKMGAANAFSTDSLLQMANAAGFAARDLDKLSGPIQKLGSNFKAMGQGAVDSTQRFMEMVNVGSEVRQEFQRLGYSQEQLVEAQAGYVELMGTAGLSLRSFTGGLGSLQKISTDYIKNLQALSEISGLDVEEQQKRMQAAAADRQFQLYLVEMNKKIAAAANDPQEQRRLAQQVEYAMAAKTEITATLGEEAGRGFGQMLAGQPVTQGVATMAMTGTSGEVNALADAARELRLTDTQIAESTDAINRKFIGLIEEGGAFRTAASVSDDVAKLLGGDTAIAENVRRQNFDEQQALKDIRERQAANERGEGESAEDPLHQARNKLTEAEIKARTKVDELANSIGFLIPTIVGLIAAAGIAALALANLGRMGGATPGAGRGGGRGGGADGRGTSGPKQDKSGKWHDERGRFTSAPEAPKSKLGKLGTLAKGAFGKLAAPLAIGMTLYDAYQGFGADPNASFGQSLKNAGSSALSGLTFGLLGSSPEEIAAKKAADAKTAEQAPAEAKTEESKKYAETQFSKSVASFGSVVTSFAKTVTAFATTTKAFATSTKTFATSSKRLAEIVKGELKNPLIESIAKRLSLNEHPERLQRRQTTLETILGRSLLEAEDNLSPLEKFELAIEASTTNLVSLREAEQKRHNLTEISMKQFRVSLEDASKKLDMISGITRDYGDPGGGGGGGGGGEGGAGASSENAQKAMRYFMSQGWSREQAAGIVGNLQAESGADLDPTEIARNDAGQGKHSYGIAQWNRGRFENLRRFADRRGTTWEDFDTQLAFIQHELEGDERGAGRRLERTTNATDAAKVIDRYYERSTGEHIGRRISFAENLASGDLGTAGTDSNGNMLDAFQNARRQSESSDGFSTISAQGKSTKVASEVAPRFQSVLDKMTNVGYKIRDLGGYVDRNVAGTNRKSAHSRGWAIDVNSRQNPDTGRGGRLITDMPAEVVQHARSLGLGWGGDWSSKKDAMHYSAQKNEGGYLQARKGGLFDGPDSGYPVELHGGEMIAPLNANSILMKLAKTPAEPDQLKQVAAPTNYTEKETIQKIVTMNSEMMDAMISKLSDMVDALSDGNETRRKILKNSQ